MLEGIKKSVGLQCFVVFLKIRNGFVSQWSNKTSCMFVRVMCAHIKIRSPMVYQEK